MIKYVKGNILDSNAYALVNSVNCDGIVGKGISSQFKDKYLASYISYVMKCENGELVMGKLHYYKYNDRIIVNFPTKDQSKQPSKIEYIEKGLLKLAHLIKDRKIKSIAIPKLGCGSGGLNWSEVKKLIGKHLREVKEETDIIIFE